MGILPLERGSYSFELFKFPDFALPSQVFHDHRFSRHIKNFLSYRAFFDLTQYNRQLWCPQKCVPFAPFNHLSLSYIVLALTSEATNLTDIALMFHDN